jgi:hypothetical protein
MEQIVLNARDIQFITEEVDEAFASVSLNPTFRWCKFILTDDRPNLNKRRIPIEEFDNLVRTGTFAPVKMELSKIGDHEGSLPIGTITALKKENNYIKGIAALWSKERPEDVAMIKQAYDDGQPLNLSWEVSCSDRVEEDDGVFALKNTALTATTFVRLPAYAGRTPILEVSSVEKETLPEQNSSVEDNELEDLELLKTRITELEALIAQKDTELAQLKSDNESLASFKSEIEANNAKVEKLNSIKSKFAEAGVSKTDEYFTENGEKLLSMEENAFDFMLQELVAFASTHKESGEQHSSVEIPNLSGASKNDPRELGRLLRTKK